MPKPTLVDHFWSIDIWSLKLLPYSFPELEWFPFLNLHMFWVNCITMCDALCWSNTCNNNDHSTSSKSIPISRSTYRSKKVGGLSMCIKHRSASYLLVPLLHGSWSLAPLNTCRLNVKGKSAKKNRLSGFVPFIQTAVGLLSKGNGLLMWTFSFEEQFYFQI